MAAGDQEVAAVTGDGHLIDAQVTRPEAGECLPRLAIDVQDAAGRPPHDHPEPTPRGDVTGRGPRGGDLRLYALAAVEERQTVLAIGPLRRRLLLHLQTRGNV